MKPWLSEQWCIGEITGDYLWHMEDVLHQYHLPYDARHPVLCFDERPCFLIDDVGGILPMSPGKAKRYHYEYKKNGSCCVFLAFEPQTGFRYVEVRDRRTAVDYAAFMQTLLARHYPQVESIRLVQDNLNTHTPGSFYAVLPPEQAFALSLVAITRLHIGVFNLTNLAEEKFITGEFPSISPDGHWITYNVLQPRFTPAEALSDIIVILETNTLASSPVFPERENYNSS